MDLAEKLFTIGLDDLNNNNYFNAYQTFQGALKRAIKTNNSKIVNLILEKASQLFIENNQIDYSCNLYRTYINSINQTSSNSTLETAKMVIDILQNLEEIKLYDCKQDIMNFILVKLSLDQTAISILENITPEIGSEFDILYLTAGFYVKVKDFESCFKSLETYYKGHAQKSWQLICYLTLSELNAYEIESCGTFLNNDDIKTPNNVEIIYEDITNVIYSALEKNIGDQIKNLLHTEEYLELIGKDRLLYLLVQGIKELIPKDKPSNLFSLF